MTILQTRLKNAHVEVEGQPDVQSHAHIRGNAHSRALPGGLLYGPTSDVITGRGPMTKSAIRHRDRFKTTIYLQCCKLTTPLGARQARHPQYDIRPL